jgi:hypothetical protein
MGRGGGPSSCQISCGRGPRSRVLAVLTKMFKLKKQITKCSNNLWTRAKKSVQAVVTSTGDRMRIIT